MRRLNSLKVMREILRISFIGAVVTIVACTGTAPVKDEAPVVKQMAQQGLDSLSDSQNLRYQKALSLMKQGKYANAQKLLVELRKKAPGLLELLLNLSIVQYQQQDFKNANHTLAQALAINDASEKANNIAGLVAIELGDFKKAETYFKKALSKDNNYAMANYNLALLYDVYLQDVSQAVAHYSQYLLVEKNDETTQAWVDHLKSSMNK